MSRIPQPTRLRQPPSSPSPSTTSTRKSFLSPKTIWTPSSKRTTPSVAKYQLQDMGVVPGSPKVVKRGTIRPPNTIGKGKTSTINRNHGGAGTANSNFNTQEFGSPMSNLAVVDSTIPSSPSPSRIPASQSYTQICQPSSRGMRITGTPSTSRIPLPQSRSTLKSPQPHLRSGIPIPKARFPTLVNNSCHSPAISICATVATVSPRSSPLLEYELEVMPGPDPESVMTMDREGNSSARESIYSSASAMALSRYRASLPDNNVEMDARSTIDRGTGQGHDLSRISSTTSYSSASSLARHRLSQARSQCQVQAQAQPMSGTTSTSSESEQALIWQPDPESTGFDPAENLWKEIEARLNRRSASVEGGRDERGQWVLTSRQKQKGRYRQGLARTDKVEIPDHTAIASTSTEMEKQESEFTISAYFDPDLSTHLTDSNTFKRTTAAGLSTGMNDGRGTGSNTGMEGTAIFDMSAPLVISNSQTGHGKGEEYRDGEVSVGKTPANTPLIHHETIQRVQRVQKSTLGIQSVGMGSGTGSTSRSSRSRLNADIAHSELGLLMRSRSDSSSAVVDLGSSTRSSTSTTTSTAFPPLQIQTGAPTRISSHTRTASISPSSTLECPPSRSAANYDISMTRLDSHVQAALEELSDYRSIYPTTATETVAGDRTPLARQEGVCGSAGARDRYSDQQNQHHHQQYRYEAEDEDEEANTFPDAEDDESTPMPFPNTVRISPTIPNAYDNDKYPLGFMEQIREKIQPDDVGLGMGMDLRLDSIYLLPVVSPRLRIPTPFSTAGRVPSPLSMPGIDLDLTSPKSISTSTSTSSPESIPRSFSPDSSKSSRPLSIDMSLSSRSDSEGDGSIYKTHDIQDEVQVYIPLLSQMSHLVEQKVEVGQEEQVEQEEEEEEMLSITDLDTGHRVDLSIKRLDEFELWRL